MRKALRETWNEWGVELFALGIVPGLIVVVVVLQWIGG